MGHLLQAREEKVLEALLPDVRPRHVIVAVVACEAVPYDEELLIELLREPVIEALGAVAHRARRSEALHCLRHDVVGHRVTKAARGHLG